MSAVALEIRAGDFKNGTTLVFCFLEKQLLLRGHWDCHLCVIYSVLVSLRRGKNPRKIVIIIKIAENLKKFAVKLYELKFGQNKYQSWKPFRKETQLKC